MMTPEQKNLLQSVQEKLKENYETKMTEDCLIFALDHVGIHNDMVKGEMEFFPEDCGVDGMVSGVLQLYFTVSLQYRESETAELLKRLAEVNEKTLVGTYHLYKPLNHIYYHYSLLLPNLLDVETCEQLIFIALAKMSAGLEYLFNYMLLIGETVENITFSEYREQMDLLQQALAENPDFLEELEQGEAES